MFDGLVLVVGGSRRGYWVVRVYPVGHGGVVLASSLAFSFYGSGARFVVGVVTRVVVLVE